MNDEDRDDKDDLEEDSEEDSDFLDEDALGDADDFEDDEGPEGSGGDDGEVVPDADLFRDWGAGDKRAGDTLIRRYLEKLRAYFASKLSQGDDVADLVQQTLEGCSRAAPTFRGDCSFRTFLYTLARNKLRDYLRAKSRRPQAEDIDEISVADLNPGPSTIRSRNRRQALVLEGLRSLRLQDQEILEFRYTQGLSMQEIADTLGVELNAAKSRLRRAKAALRKALEG